MIGYGSHWGMMGDWGGWGGSWFGPLNMLFWPLLLVLVIAAIVWFVHSTGRTGGEPPAARRPLELLEERYARGEIGRDEYLQKKRDILE